MKQSLRAKRLARHHKRLGTASKLNLVSLMDIFTILVFFLIVNQSEVRVLQNSEKLDLPISIAEELPSENIVIAVFDNRVMVQERAVWQKPASKPSTNLTPDDLSALMKALATELNYLASKRVELTELEQENGRAVTILGDANIEYAILKQIMTVCAQANFRNMSLAVEQVAASKSPSSAKSEEEG
ncbi:MAG: ExbD/TolR family protein [Cognaticolwellia sp.]